MRVRIGLTSSKDNSNWCELMCKRSYQADIISYTQTRVILNSATIPSSAQSNIWRLNRIKDDQYQIILNEDQDFWSNQSGWVLSAYYDKSRGCALVVLDKDTTKVPAWRIKEISNGSGDYQISLMEDIHKRGGVDMSGWLLCQVKEGFERGIEGWFGKLGDLFYATLCKPDSEESRKASTNWSLLITSLSQ